MKIVGIISEYNPFHNGHKHHIEQTRTATDCDAVVCVMSPNYVQRGEPAVFDKQARTKAALLSGVDLMLELPTSFALSSADRFALGGINILSSIGVISTLSFGSESGDIIALSKVSKLIDNPSVRLAAAELQKKVFLLQLQDKKQSKKHVPILPAFSLLLTIFLQLNILEQYHGLTLTLYHLLYPAKGVGIMIQNQQIYLHQHLF